ncbi:MAG TPA: hypothetical protein VF989_05910 [Polyangiaceae bacterium]|jgi:hypothetical protein
MNLGQVAVVSVLLVSLSGCRVLKSFAGDDEQEQAAAAASAAALEAQKKLEAAKAAVEAAEKKAAEASKQEQASAGVAEPPTPVDFEEEAFETITASNYEQKLGELEKELDAGK